MTKRTRSHVLEDLSIAALRSALPERWVIHEFKRDYGIDVQIEIFDEADAATGLRCYGQLKATDKVPTSDVLSLDREHFEYWANHSDPVLLFRYFESTQCFSWCWLHEVAWRIKPGVGSLDVSNFLRPFDVVRTPGLIRQFLLLRRETLFARMTPPYSIAVTNSAHGDTHRLAGRIRETLDSRSFEVMGNVTSPTHFDVVLDRTKIMVSHLGLPGFVADVGSSPTDVLFEDLAVLLIFLTACRYQRVLTARSIATLRIDVLQRAAVGDLEALLVDGVMYATGVESAVELLSGSGGTSVAPEVWLMLLSIGLLASRRYGESEQWIRQLRKWDREPRTPENAGCTAYNLGNALSQEGAWDEALRAFLRAAERDPSYLERSYYWAEVGAAQFESELYEDASKSYTRAFELGMDPSEMWKLADALFHMGRYRDARRLLQRWSERDDAEVRSYPQLILLLCEELTDTWQIEEQVLGVIGDSSYSALETLTPEPDFQNCVFALRPFIEVNALDALLGFNLGHFARISGHHQLSMFRYLTCALRQRGDAEAWAQAVGSALLAQEPEVTALLVDCGYFYVGERLVEKLLEFIVPNTIDPAERTAFRDSLQELARGAKSDRGSHFRVRLCGPNADDGDLITEPDSH